MFSNIIRKKLPVSFNCQNGKKATTLLIVKPNLGTTIITCLKLLVLSASKGPHSNYVCTKNKTDVHKSYNTEKPVTLGAANFSWNREGWGQSWNRHRGSSPDCLAASQECRLKSGEKIRVRSLRLLDRCYNFYRMWGNTSETSVTITGASTVKWKTSNKQ